MLSIQFNFNSILFAINKKIQHKYIIDDTQYSYYYNIHTWLFTILKVLKARKPI